MAQPVAPSGMLLIPADWGWPARHVKGIWVAGCVHHSGGLKGWTGGDAHSHLSGPSEGWICFRGNTGVLREDGAFEPSDLAIHHLAHLIVGAEHSPRWARVARNWGGHVGEDEISKPMCLSIPYRKV